jgi:hypothetical protein
MQSCATMQNGGDGMEMELKTHVALRKLEINYSIRFILVDSTLFRFVLI